MKIIVIPRTEYIDTINTKIYKETYFGNFLSTTADVEVVPEWVSTKTDYKYLDEVYIDALKTKYTATVDNPVGHPNTSNNWFGEGINENRMLDRLFTSQAVFTGSCVNEFNIIAQTHIVGQNLDNVKEIKMIFYRHDGSEISTVFDCDRCVEPETQMVMAYYESFDCDSCCGEEIVYKNNFFLKFNPLSCSNVAKVKVIMTRFDELKPIRVGTLAVGKAHDLGCAVSGMTPELNMPRNIVAFPAISQTGVMPANIETTMRGTTLIERGKVDELRQLMSRHGAFLNFYVLDEIDEVTGAIVLGRFTRFATPLTTADKVVLPIEIFGIQN